MGYASTKERTDPTHIFGCTALGIRESGFAGRKTNNLAGMKRCIKKILERECRSAREGDRTLFRICRVVVGVSVVVEVGMGLCQGCDYRIGLGLMGGNGAGVGIKRTEGDRSFSIQIGDRSLQRRCDRVRFRVSLALF